MKASCIAKGLRKLAALALCAVLAAGAASASASDLTVSEYIVSDEYKDLVPELQPLDLACEQVGIRVELLQGCVKGDRGLLVFSIQDLEGDRVSGYTSDSISMDDIAFSPQSSYRIIRYDEAEKEVIVVQETRFSEPVQAADREVTLVLRGLWEEHGREIDLIPYVKEYAAETTGIDVPELIPLWSEAPQDDMERRRELDEARAKILPSMKVLDYTRPLDIPLSDNVFLTGAGWIDGMLHIQFRYTNNGKVYYGNGSWYFPLMVRLPEGIWDNYGPDAESGMPIGSSPLQWDVTGDGKEDWAEYLFFFQPEDLDSTELIMTIEETSGIIDGEWEFTLPLSALLSGSPADEPPQAETAPGTEEAADDPEAADLLEAFFLLWKDNDVDSMLGLCSPSWTGRQEDPKLELFRLLANRTPLNWSVVMIRGSAGEPVRTAVVEAVIDRNNGRPAAMYRLSITLVRESDGLLYVDPQCLQAWENPEAPVPEATEAPEATETPSLHPDTVIYYNPAGGELYHLDQNCPAVGEKWRPLEGQITWAELNSEAYSYLHPCQVCGAPLREP